MSELSLACELMKRSTVMFGYCSQSCGCNDIFYSKHGPV